MSCEIELVPQMAPTHLLRVNMCRRWHHNSVYLRLNIKTCVADDTKQCLSASWGHYRRWPHLRICITRETRVADDTTSSAQEGLVSQMTPLLQHQECSVTPHDEIQSNYCLCCVFMIMCLCCVTNGYLYILSLSENVGTAGIHRPSQL